FMLLNPDLERRDKLRPGSDPEEAEDRPRVFGLAMAASLEEIKRDIDLRMSWMLWVILLLSGAAACVAWLFSRMLTRPLKRIIKATECVAEDSIDAPLP